MRWNTVGSSGRQGSGNWRISGRIVIERETARRGAHEALPHTPPGGKPPETPAPFPSGSMFQNGGSLSRVRKPRKNGAPLTGLPPFRKPNWDEGKGAQGKWVSRSPVGRPRRVAQNSGKEKCT
jgi:hypothetical protein